MLSPILALFARISKPLWLNIRSTGAEVAGGHKTFSSNGCSTLYVSLCATSIKGHTSWVMKTESPWCQVPRPRLRGSRPRPRPRLVKTGLETKTQVSRTPSLVISKWFVRICGTFGSGRRSRSWSRSRSSSHSFHPNNCWHDNSSTDQNCRFGFCQAFMP